MLGVSVPNAVASFPPSHCLFCFFNSCFQGKHTQFCFACVSACAENGVLHKAWPFKDVAMTDSGQLPFISGWFLC